MTSLAAATRNLLLQFGRMHEQTHSHDLNNVTHLMENRHHQIVASHGAAFEGDYHDAATSRRADAGRGSK
jgi:hypothetical protein